LQHNTICIRRKISRNLQLLNTATLMNDTAMASADCSWPWHACQACRPRLSANAETAITRHSARPWLAWM